MKQIRRSIFETNSSSTHTITMCMKSDYDAWKAGKVYLNAYGTKRFVTKEEAIDILKKYHYHPPIKDIDMFDNEDWEDAFYDCEIYTYENYYNRCLENYEENFTTPTGETVVAFGLFGRDG